MDARLALLLLFAVASAQAFNCHQCNSNTEGQEDCASHEFGDEDGNALITGYLTACPSDGNDYNKCRKIEQYIRGERSVIRTCGHHTSETKENYNKGCYTTVLEEYSTEVCSCEVEGCNGSSALSSSLVSVLFFTLLAYFVSK